LLVHCNKRRKAQLHVVRHGASDDGRPVFVKVLGVAQVPQDLQPALGVAPLHQLAHRLAKELSHIGTAHIERVFVSQLGVAVVGIADGIQVSRRDPRASKSDECHEFCEMYLRLVRRRVRVARARNTRASGQTSHHARAVMLFAAKIIIKQ
jgi:hypothetical protein